MRSYVPLSMYISIVSSIVAVFLAACTSPSPSTPAAAPTSAQASGPAITKPSSLKIGHIVPLTGNNSETGIGFNQTAQMAIENLNTAGGVNGVKLELAAEDSMADPKQGIVALNKLVQVDKAPVVLGAWSSVVMAAAPVADENKVVFVNYGANAISIRGAGQFTFSAYPLSDLDIKILAEYAYGKLNARNAAVIFINNDTGRSSGSTFKAAFEAKGGKLVAFESHEPDAMDFGAQLAKIKAASPDVLHIHSLLGETPRIVKQARELGIKAQLTSYSTAESQQLLDVAGEAVDGLIYTFLAPPETKPEVKEFYDRWRAKFGKLPPASGVAMYVWDIVTTMIPDAIKYAEQKGYGYSGDAIRRAIVETKEFDTKVSGKTVFQFPGQDVKKPVTLKKINAKEKKFETVTVVEP